MSKAIERIEQLITLAVSSASEEEARNAALQACRLIARHKLEVRAKPAPVTAQAPPEAKSQRPSARVRTPLNLGGVNVNAVGQVVRDMAVEAASRVTLADVVDVFAKRGRR